MIKSNNLGIRRDELDKPLRRPTTPMTNLSNTGNSQIFNAVEKKIPHLNNKISIKNPSPKNNTSNAQNSKVIILYYLKIIT